MQCLPDSIMVACQAILAMMNLLRNIEPNVGVGGNPTSHYKDAADWGVVPKLQRFLGKLTNGYGFL